MSVLVHSKDIIERSNGDVVKLREGELYQFRTMGYNRKAYDYIGKYKHTTTVNASTNGIENHKAFMGVFDCSERYESKVKEIILDSLVDIIKY